MFLRRSSLGLAVLLAACSSSERGPSPLGQREQPIYKGTFDANPEMFPAVMALIATDAQGNSTGACTGTVIATKGGSGILLTAAHCVVEVDPNTGQVISPLKPLPPAQLFVVRGNDYAAPTIVFPVTKSTIHPSFEPQFLDKDFAVLRFLGAPAGLPTIAPLTAAEDKLALNQVLDVVGYGQTNTNLQNTQRYRVKDTLAELYADLLGFKANDSTGICHGDSGGPSITLVNGQRRVAGVSSFSFDPNCLDDQWYAGRVSAVNSTFIQPFINSVPAKQTCDECRSASVYLGGSCSGAVDACTNNADCTAFLDCANACAANDQACVQQCASQHQTGVGIYQGIFECQCSTGCQAECAQDALCQPPAETCGVEYPNEDNCNGCINQNCCAVEQACADDASCYSCLLANPPESCKTNAKLAQYQHCYLSKCGASTACDTGQNKCGFTASDADCKTCLEGTCCQTLADCFNDFACYQCATGAASGPACSSPLFDSFLKCYTQDCGVACGFQGQGGSSGSGGGAGKGGSAGSGGSAAGAGGSSAGAGGSSQAGSGGSAQAGSGGQVAGSGGSAGEGGSSAGSGGTEQGGAGQGGSGQAGSGAQSGQAGEGQGGQAGEGQAGAGAGGEGQAGQAGSSTAGSSGSGGSSGQGGSGGSSAGAGGEGGEPAQGGSGGSAGQGGKAGQAGKAGSAGTAGQTSAGGQPTAPATSPESSDDGGCDCGVVRERPAAGWGLGVWAIGALVARWRRRR